jgi:hypothetical protein
MRKTNIEGPGNWQFDIALSRVFHIREGQTVEFRGEAFNVTNGLRKADPRQSTGSLTFANSNADPNGVSLNSNTFGQIRYAYDPRILQFALKYAF